MRHELSNYEWMGSRPSRTRDPPRFLRELRITNLPYGAYSAALTVSPGTLAPAP
jgi:hypothetical protein